MIFQEEELDASVREVQAKAILDIAEQNKDIATARSQKLQTREANKKRLLEQARLESPVVKPTGLTEDDPVDPKVHADLAEETAYPIDVSPALEEDDSLIPRPTPNVDNTRSQTPMVQRPNLADDVVKAIPIPEFPKDEFLALEPGKSLGTLAKDGTYAEKLTGILPAIDIAQDGLSSPDLAVKLDDAPIDDHAEALLKAKAKFEGENLPTTAVTPKPDLYGQGRLVRPEVSPELYDTDPLAVKASPKLDDRPMEPFALSPRVEEDAPLAVKATADIPADAESPKAQDADVDQDPSNVPTAETKVPGDGNFSGKADVKADDLDHFFSSYVKTVQESTMSEKIRANLRSPTMVVDSEVEIDNTDAGMMPFVGAPGGFANAVAEGGSDGNFADKLAAGAVSVITTTLKEFVTDVIDEAFKEFDENFLGFDVANVLENCLKNIQNQDPGQFGYVDREFRLTSGQEASLRDLVSASLKGSYQAYSQTDPLATVDWDRFDGMIASIAEQMHSVVRGDATIQEVAGDAVKALEKILGGMLSDKDYPGNVSKRGVNHAIDALVGAGPDLYKNMYDLVIVQVGEKGFLEQMAGGGETECTVDEFMVNILGNSFLAVRAGGVTIPEMKTKTVDIPVLWTTVTKATQQTDMSKKQTLTIDADQYLFLYDTFMKAAGKFYASSSYGLVSSDWKNELTGLVPVQLGSLCGKSWSDVGFNKKLSTKTRVDVLVKLRNFSPFLMGDRNAAPGKEPYFVFEDVRFLGNGSLQFSRADASKATFDTDFIFRRAYKVNVNSHAGSAEKSTMARIGAVDYLTPPSFIAPNDPAKVNSASHWAESISTQLGVSGGDSQSDLRSLASSRGGEMIGSSGRSVDLARIDRETRDAAAQNRMSVACASLVRDVNALVDRLLSEFKAGAVGEQPQAHSEDSTHVDAVGPKKPETPSFKFQKPNWTPITNVVTAKVAEALGSMAQSQNGHAPDMDDDGAKSSVKRATGSVDKAHTRIEQKQDPAKVTNTIAKSIRSLDESTAINNANAEKAIGD